MAAPVPGAFEQNSATHKALVRNLISRTKAFSPETIASGKNWYPSGQVDAQYLGDRMGRDALAGGAILGKLSGQTDWNVNRMQGLQVLDLTDRQGNMINRALEIQKNGDKDEAAALRRRAVGGTPLGNQNLPNLAAVLKVRNNEVEDPMSIFNIKKNTSNKTPEFALALATGGTHPAPVIDTHAYDAALDDYNIKYGTANDHLAKAGTYKFMQGVYTAAHAHALRHGLVPSDTTLSDFQAMHWVHQINNKVAVNPSAARSAKSAVSITNNLMEANPQWNPANHGLAAITTRAHHINAFNEGMGLGNV